VAEFDDAFVELRGRAPVAEEQREAMALATIYKRYPTLDPLAILVILTGRIPEQVRAAAKDAAVLGEKRGEAATIEATQRKIEEYVRRRADGTTSLDAQLSFGLTLSVVVLAVAIGAFVAGRVDATIASRATVTWPRIVPWWVWMIGGMLGVEFVRLVVTAFRRRATAWSGLVAAGALIGVAVVTRSLWVR